MCEFSYWRVLGAYHFFNFFGLDVFFIFILWFCCLRMKLITDRNFRSLCLLLIHFALWVGFSR